MKKALILGLSLVMVVGAVVLASNIGKAQTTPKISNIRAYVTVNQISIYWNTDVTTTSTVEYGKTSGDYTNSIDSSAGSSTSHQVDISSLDYETTYYYRISAKDIDGNTAQSDELSFQTSSKELRFDAITVVDTTYNNAYVRVSLNKLALASIKYGISQDALDKDAVSGDVYSGSGLQTFNFFFNNLSPETKYYFKVTASRGEFWHGETESVTSETQTFTTTGTPSIIAIDPDKGPGGTEATITGKNFGKGPAVGTAAASTHAVAVGCDLSDWPLGSPTYNCLADLISWSDTTIVIKTNKQSKNGAISVGKNYIMFGNSSQYGHFFTIKGPTFTVSGSKPTNVNEPVKATNYVTNAYGCDFSTSVSDENTIKVSTLFTKDSDTDKYLSQVYNLYQENWGRVPRCSEMQFHLDHSTPLDRLSKWLENQAITNKYGCNFSTTLSDENTILVKTLFTFDSNIDKYLNEVYNVYFEEWGRYPRCSEMQFHLDHSTPIDRLTKWLQENKPKITNVNALPTEVVTEKIEFKDVDNKVELKDEKQNLKFKQNAQITFTGTTIPNAFVVLTINSESTIATTVSNDKGEWSYTLPGPLELGEHTIKVAVSDKDGKKVSESDPVEFSIVSGAKAVTPISITETIKDNTALWLVGMVVLALIVIVVVYFVSRKKPQTPPGPKK